MNISGITPQSQFYNSPYPINRPNSNGITWVQGVEGAKAYQLMPNSNIILMDSESDKFYIKTCDNVGMCALRTFKYEEITDFCKNSENPVDLSQYITRDELEDILKEKNYVKQSLQSAKSSSTNATTNTTNKRTANTSNN